MRLKIGLAILVTALSAPAISPSRTADTLPSRLGNAEYWRMISDFSEPDGSFQLEIMTSNETSYQYVLPQLTETVGPGGAYMGVGPEQNFTYIAALQPKMAFLIDIRRDMMLEHLMYKAIFEMSPNRADFVSKLFSRKRPAGLSAESSVRAIFQAFAEVESDATSAEEHLKSILTCLKTVHRFPLAAADEARIRSIYLTFVREGPVSFYSSFMSPGYARLMIMTDGNGRNWSFFVNEKNYDRIRLMQRNNLIVPLVGDFAGPKAVRMAGRYLREHSAVVNVFYISNVEEYIDNWPQYVRNIASLPVDNSSMFIRWSRRSWTSLAPMVDFIRAQSIR